MKRRILNLVVALMAFAATTMAQNLSVATIEATPGTETTITVNIAGAAEMTALQCNLQLPKGLTLAGNITLGDAAKGHTLSTSTLASGELLIVLYDLYQSTFTDGTLLTIPVVAAKEPSTTEGTLHKVRTATVAAESKALSDVKFSAVVGEEEPAEQYYYYLGTSPDESLITPDNYKEFCQKVSKFPAEQQIVSVDDEYLYVVLPADKDMFALDLNVGIGELNFKYYSSTLSTYIPTKNKNVRLTFDDEKEYVIYRSAATALGPYGVNIKEETPVTSIVLDCTEASMQVGGSIDITATVNPQDATWYKVMWSSDNASVATVDNNGKVTALSEGSTTITAEACDNSGITASCTITVKSKVVITVPEDAVYFWASSDGEVVEKGGVASGYGAGEGRVNYKNDVYYTLSINAKKENINKDYILITLDEPLKANDKIEVTAYRNKDTDANATLYYLFENGYSIDEGGEVLWNNIALNQEPNTRSYTVGEGSGSQSIKITRSKAGTNVFITKFVITRSTTDAIEKIDLNSNAVIYNLYGKQIQATSVDELPSGLYIVNGKKILVK